MFTLYTEIPAHWHSPSLRAMGIVDCSSHGWGFELASLLERNEQAELINVNFEVHRKPIEELSKAFGANFEHEPEAKAVRFRPMSD